MNTIDQPVIWKYTAPGGRAALKAAFLATDAPFRFRRTLDVRPGHGVPVAWFGDLDSDAHRVVTLRWGLPDPHGNAPLRTEIDIRTGGVWRQVIMNADTRCLIPANDFSVDGLRARVKGEGIFAFAGIWSPLRRQPSFAILCYKPNDVLMSRGGTKMPVIVDRAQYEAWLGADATTSLDVLQPFPVQRLIWERT